MAMDRETRRMIIFLAAAIVLAVGFDVFEIVSGRASTHHWIPGVLPVTLSVWLVVVRRSGRSEEVTVKPRR